MASQTSLHDGEEATTMKGSSSDEQPVFENWMRDLPEKLHNEPLKNIAIPGSHDSFSYFLDCKSPVASGSPDTVRNLVSVFGDAARKIVHNWSVTQSLDFQQQLQLGIRYFDFRVSFCRDRNGFFFVHGLHGNEVCEGLRTIKAWLDDHPKEVVLLDFNHLYDMDGKHEQLIVALEEIFSSKLCPHMEVSSVSLRMLWENGWQVLLIYHDSIASSRGCIWPAPSIFSVWPNTTEPVQMVNILNAYHTRGRPRDRFYVSQGVLTPTGTAILQHISRSLRDVLARPAIKNTKFFLKDKKIGPEGVNIVIADFVEIDHFVETVLALNH
ncbi:PI-PLC X domain-containing protein 3-like [Diadema setosum]|uniref:PI-PLC X domain-containing protein 3-like n=1 Tax=Diadema setosum TaxID=31175 RepID=UPI003B3BD51C